MSQMLQQDKWTLTFAKHFQDILNLYPCANPPGIVTIQGPEFTVDMKKMEPHVRYIVELLHLRYLIWKDENDALIINKVA